MILIFFLCLKLSILHLCVSDLGYRCTKDDASNNPEIFLIDDRINHHNAWSVYSSYPDGFNFQEKLNFKFISLCKNYYNINIGSLKSSEYHTNVIHFAVPGYYDGKPLKNFEYAGNISKIDDAVCTKTGKARPKFDCHEIVNLVSKSLLKINDGHVYNFVQKMQISEYSFEVPQSCEPLSQNTSDLTIVLLCLRGPFSHKEVNIKQPLQLIQVADCSSNLNKTSMQLDLRVSWVDDSSYLDMNRLLAVLAPEPFGVLSEYSVPTIFYETPYLFSENKTAFPNSMNLVPWRLLKYGFLKFIQTVGWQRVAIVTDDSEYSVDFEDELTALFNKERLIYTVIRCEDANCEMEKIAQELKSVSPRIVIANVEEKHVQYLFRNTHGLTWLVRDMVVKSHNQELPNHHVAFSLSLSIDTYTKGCHDVEDNILTGLSSIAQAYENISQKDYKVKKREFYRHFANITKHVTPRITKAKVVVHKLYGLEEVSTMFVDATGAKLITFTNPFESKPNDGTADCFLTNYDYHNSCDDPLVMFLMFALMLFMLTLLLISCYFDKTSPFNDIRYQNF